MPIYLCKPGWMNEEPWRHGVQVYAYPFPMQDTSTAPSSQEEEQPTGAHTATTEEEQEEQEKKESSNHQLISADDKTIRHRNTKVITRTSFPIRRIRHSEIVLVDQVSIRYGRYWFRLRWPGPRGGLAGYIALGLIPLHTQVQDSMTRTLDLKQEAAVAVLTLGHHGTDTDTDANFIDPEDECMDPNARVPQDTETDEEEDVHGSAPRSRTSSNSKPSSYSIVPICSSSGLNFPTSPSMQLLVTYEDGLSSPITGMDSDILTSDGRGEPVFCRICREGLHDVNYDTAAAEEEDDGGHNSANTHKTILDTEPLTNHKNLVLNHPYAENPLLAPCDCAGSMAFVHYLCVEQWRCRSDHPTARNGLCCETCGTAYSLPPPPSRPSPHGDDDLLQAIPPHVIQALRRPHIFWRVGAAIVRRRWLRLIAPILVSPIVSLYCRARRMLKKRGVSRRRWACSLCRRRARWKCVRCLRSYYCSRQCQNVSWHIVHKHVCYKPVRFWWSVTVYGIGAFFMFPGILKHPIVYDWGLSMLILSFLVMALVGGSFAVFVKRLLQVDIRGRGLEVFVVLSTLWLARLSWGLVWAYFGDQSMCHSSLLWFFRKRNEPLLYPVAMLLQWTLFRPGKLLIDLVDRIFLNSSSWIRSFICAEVSTCAKLTDAQSCISNEMTCFRTTKRVNPDFFLSENFGETNCAVDIDTVLFFWLLAAFLVMTNFLTNRRDRQRRLLARERFERLHND